MTDSRHLLHLSTTGRWGHTCVSLPGSCIVYTVYTDFPITQTEGPFDSLISLNLTTIKEMENGNMAGNSSAV